MDIDGPHGLPRCDSLVVCDNALMALDNMHVPATITEGFFVEPFSSGGRMGYVIRGLGRWGVHIFGDMTAMSDDGMPLILVTGGATISEFDGGPTREGMIKSRYFPPTGDGPRQAAEHVLALLLARLHDAIGGLTVATFLQLSSHDDEPLHGESV